MTKHKDVILIFLLSTASMLYEYLLGSVLSIYMGGDLFVYPLIIFLFILGMGVGSNVSSKITKDIYNNLYINEIKIIFFAYIGFYLLVMNFRVEEFPLISLLIGITLSFIIGYYTGKELPLILKNSNLDKKIVFFDYFASFISAIIFIKFLNVYFFSIEIIPIIISINIFTLILIKRKVVTNILLICSSIILILNNPIITNYIIKQQYNIDNNSKIIIKEKTKHAEIIGIESKGINGLSFYHLYLNNSIQFYTNISNKNLYHSVMIEPMKKFKKNSKVLILGGGDGFPSKFLKLNGFLNLTLVDIDQDWINLSKSNSYLLDLNNNSLKNNKIIIESAFDFVRKSREKYDIVIIDFPEFDSLESLRIHSVEFLEDLKKITNRNSIIIYQEDKKTSKNISDIITKTNIYAGFYSIKGTEKRTNNKKRYITQYVLSKNPMVISKIKNDSSNFLKYSSDYNNESSINTYLEPSLMQERIKSFLKLGDDNE